jgi:hypothetical protein
MFKKLIAGLITAVLSLGAVALIAGPASAHHNTINPTVTCATSGAYTVTWAVTNSESAKTEVITQSNLPGVVAVGENFAFSETRNFTQSVDTPQDITLTLTGFWADGNVYSQNSGSISKGSFPTGCLKVTAVATPYPSECNGPGTYTDPTYSLTAVTGVKYIVNGTEKAAGTYTATNGTTVNITADVTDAKYQLVGTTSWSFTFNAPANPCTKEVTPVTPTVTQSICTTPGQHTPAQYTIPNTTGVLYSVKINGVETDKTAGTYDLVDSVADFEVIARPDSAHFYTLPGNVSSISFPLKANDRQSCVVLVVPVNPNVTVAVCDALAPGVVPPTTYTLVPVDHVIYLVSIDGAAAVPVPADGNAVPVPQGTHLVVTALSEDSTKWTTTAGWTFDKTFPAPGDCKLKLTPKSPDPVDQFCDDSDPLHPFLTDAGIIVDNTPNLRYFIDGALAPAGLNKVAPGHHSVTFEVTDTTKYFLDPLAPASFEFDIAPGKCIPTYPDVIPAAASSQIGCFTPGSYTLTNNLNDPSAVVWTVNGSQVSAGKYTVTTPGTVTIVAAPNAPLYGFQTGIQTTWTVNFAKPSVCDVETLAMTGQSPTGLLIAADFLVVAGLALFSVRALRRGRFQMG